MTHLKTTDQDRFNQPTNRLIPAPLGHSVEPKEDILNDTPEEFPAVIVVTKPGILRENMILAEPQPDLQHSVVTILSML